MAGGGGGWVKTTENKIHWPLLHVINQLTNVTRRNDSKYFMCDRESALYSVHHTV